MLHKSLIAIQTTTKIKILLFGKWHNQTEDFHKNKKV